MKERIKQLLREQSLPVCMMVTAKPCLPGPPVNTDSSKCATLDGVPVTLQDMHEIVTFGNNPETYKIAGMTSNPNGNGSDDINSSNKSCGCDPGGSFPPNFDWATWADTWTNNNAFQNVNNNPNQPCNHICQRKQLWTSQIPNAGPLWGNMLYCRLQTAEQQIQIHGCNC